MGVRHIPRIRHEINKPARRRQSDSAYLRIQNLLVDDAISQKKRLPVEERRIVPIFGKYHSFLES